MVVTWEVTIPELTGKEKRMAYVYLPKSYDEDKTRTYPILYMFDGHNVFFDSHATYGKSWGMKDYLDANGDEIIVAAVECNHHPDNGRLKEYSPFSFENKMFGKVEGLGDITMQWLVKDFMPYVEKKFRCKRGREYTWIAGSSMGGLMSLYALVAYNDRFSRAAALSPSISVDIDAMTKLIEKTKFQEGTVLYMDFGEHELSHSFFVMKDFAHVSELLMKKGVLVTSRIVPGGYHCEASWEKQIPIFLRTLEYDL